MKIYWGLFLISSTVLLAACSKQAPVVMDGSYTRGECTQLSGIASSEFTGIVSHGCLASGDCHFEYLCPSGTKAIGSVGSGLEGGVCCK